MGHRRHRSHTPDRRTDARAPGGRAAAVAALALLAAGAAAIAWLRARRRHERRWRATHLYRYHERSGFPRSAGEMRGVARQDFTPPPDMATPPALRPWSAD